MEDVKRPVRADRIEVPDEKAREAIRLSFLLHDVSRMRRTAYDQLMKPLGVTRAQWWVLAHLSRHDGMMQTELAESLDVGKASLGTLVNRLQTAGLVKCVNDPIDKRAKRVFMAKAGHQLIKRMMAEEHRFNERILRDLSREDRQMVIQKLSLIKAALGETLSSGAPHHADRDNSDN